MQYDNMMFKALKLRKRAFNRVILAIAPVQARLHQQTVLTNVGIDVRDTYNWGEVDVDNYIEAYDCNPPPLFIPFITLVEVCLFAYIVLYL